MSMRALPILFLNMSGEMMYIIEERLRAQQVGPEKASRVLRDIIGLMFKPTFLNEVFKPQELYSKKAIRTIFERLSHASIMRLNEASMDKLYDLMVMAVKYQTVLCPRPKDLLLVTLNHLDALKAIVTDSPIAADAVNAYKLLIQHYLQLSEGQFIIIRQTIMGFFQDSHVRVSVFLKEKLQSSNGRFCLPIGGPLPFGIEAPGTIDVFNKTGAKAQTFSFACNENYSVTKQEGSFEISGARGTSLGKNMYQSTSSDAKPADTQMVLNQATTAHGGAAGVSDFDQNVQDPDVRRQLDLLASLIGAPTAQPPVVTMNLFNSDSEERAFASQKPVYIESTGQVVKVDVARLTNSDELTKIMRDLDLDRPQRQQADSDDLLDLMDQAGY